MLEDKIKIGEYVRTKNGYILKNTIKDHKHIIDGIINQNEKYKYKFDNIEKHSKDIIELIENNDILKIEISEEWVEKQDKEKIIIVGQMAKLEEIKRDIENGIYIIKQISTHEQFENRCYILEE